MGDKPDRDVVAGSDSSALTAMLGLGDNRTVSPAEFSRPKANEFRLLRFSFNELNDPDRLRNPEPPPDEGPRKGEMRPLMRLFINLFGVDGLW